MQKPRDTGADLMLIRPQRLFERLPEGRLVAVSLAEILCEPIQEEAAHRVIVPGARDGGDARRRVLAVAVPQGGRNVNRRADVDLCEERLVFVHLQLTSKVLLESTHALADVTADEQVRRTRRRAPAEGIKCKREFRRLVQSVEPCAERGDDVLALRIAPAPPIFGCAADHTSVRMGAGESDLFCKLLWKPYVVGIEEGDELAT